MSESRDFCEFCGASLPPNDGEGTCKICSFVLTYDGTDPPRLVSGSYPPPDHPLISGGDPLIPVPFKLYERGRAIGWKTGTVDEFLDHIAKDHRPRWRRALGWFLKNLAYALAFAVFCLLCAWAAVAFGVKS